MDKNICYPPITIHYDNRVVTTNEVYLHDHYIEIDDFRIDINIAMIATNISFEKIHIVVMQLIQFLME